MLRPLAISSHGTGVGWREGLFAARAGVPCPLVGALGTTSLIWKRWQWFDCEDGFRFRYYDALNCRKGTRGVMGSHVFQHVRCRLNGLLTNLVHADLVPTVFTCHKSAACNVSRRCVHALNLHSIGDCCPPALGQQPWIWLLPHLSVLPNPPRTSMKAQAHFCGAGHPTAEPKRHLGCESTAR